MPNRSVVGWAQLEAEHDRLSVNTFKHIPFSPNCYTLKNILTCLNVFRLCWEKPKKTSNLVTHFHNTLLKNGPKVRVVLVRRSMEPGSSCKNKPPRMVLVHSHSHWKWTAPEFAHKQSTFLLRTALRRWTISSFKDTAEHNTHNSRPSILFSSCCRCWLLPFNDSWSLSLLHSMEDSRCATAQSCSEMVRNFTEWAFLFYVSHLQRWALLFILLCFKVEKRTVGRSTNEKERWLHCWCVKCIQPWREQTWINKTSTS